MSVESVAKNFITRCWVSTVSIITDVVTEVLTTFTISDCQWCNEQRCPQKTVKRNHESDDRTQFSLQGQFELHHCLSKAGALVIIYTIKLANVGNSGTASVTSSTTCVSNEKERRKCDWSRNLTPLSKPINAKLNLITTCSPEQFYHTCCVMFVNTADTSGLKKQALDPLPRFRPSSVSWRTSAKAGRKVRSAWKANK